MLSTVFKYGYFHLNNMLMLWQCQHVPGGRSLMDVSTALIMRLELGMN